MRCLFDKFSQVRALVKVNLNSLLFHQCYFSNSNQNQKITVNKITDALVHCV